MTSLNCHLNVGKIAIKEEDVFDKLLRMPVLVRPGTGSRKPCEIANGILTRGYVPM